MTFRIVKLDLTFFLPTNSETETETAKIRAGIIAAALLDANTPEAIRAAIVEIEKSGAIVGFLSDEIEEGENPGDTRTAGLFELFSE